MSSRQALVALLLSALAHPAAAQLTEKQAVAHVKAVSKAQIKLFKQDGAEALATLDLQLGEAEAQFAADTGVPDVAGAASDAAIAFMDTMNAAWFSTVFEPAKVAAEDLESLSGGGFLNGIYPKELYFGTGGVLDAHRKSLFKAATKLRDAATKRLAKTAARAEKSAGIALTFHLEFPTTRRVTTVNEDDTVGFTESARLDVIVATSAFDTDDDGVLVISGTTGVEVLPVTVQYVGPDPASDSQQPALDPVTGRFTSVFGLLGAGGYVVSVSQDPNSFGSVGEIGIR